jgi:peroxiredoxin
MKYLIVFVLIGLVAVTVSCVKGAKGRSEKKYLEELLSNLNEIKSATYTSTYGAYDPGDTIPEKGFQQYYFKEYTNTKDTSVSASYVKLLHEDTTKMVVLYDGVLGVEADWERETLRVDDFKNNPWPFRVVYGPFFARAKSIIKFALETKDSVQTDLKDYGDSVQYSISVFDHVVEFVGKLPVYEHPYGSEKGQVSTYEIWISKTSGLPFKVVRDLPHSKTIEIVSNLSLNVNKIQDFISSAYFPAGFPVRKAWQSGPSSNEVLIGKVAADWSLQDADSSIVALRELNDKVVLIHFTGIGCGPCQSSLPFLKQLATDSKSKDFEVVSIETWGSSLDKMKKYQAKNGINFRFLKSDSTISKNYQIGAVPAFFVLDKRRVIQRVFNGYSQGTTEKEIKTAINELL